MDNSFPERIWADRDLDDWGKGFWASTRVGIILQHLRHRSLFEIVDVGSGNGELVSLPLAQAGMSVTCVEPLAAGARVTRERGLVTHQSTLGDSPIGPESVKAVGLFDVLEDTTREDDLLADVLQVLAPGGLLLVSVPGHQWLFSDYDLAVGTRRRYSRKSLRNILERNGFVVEKVCGVFGFLVPYALLTRRAPYVMGIRRDLEHHSRGATRAARLPGIVDTFLERWAALEYRLGSPWGLSIFAAATKPTANTARGHR